VVVVVKSYNFMFDGVLDELYAAKARRQNSGIKI